MACLRVHCTGPTAVKWTNLLVKSNHGSQTEEKKGKQMRKEVLWAVVITTTEACVIFSFSKKRSRKILTSFLTALFIAVVRAVILAVTSPWQTNAASVSTTELVSRAHGSGCRVHKHASFIQLFILQLLLLISFWLCQTTNTYKDTKQMLHNVRKQLLTAVLLVWLVITVKLSVTPPASIDAHPTAAHEFNWSAGLVGSCTNRITEKCHSGQKRS